jgi:hypothetical protein
LGLYPNIKGEGIYDFALLKKSADSKPDIVSIVNFKAKIKNDEQKEFVRPMMILKRAHEKRTKTPTTFLSR